MPFLFEFDAVFVAVAFVLLIFFLWRAKRYFPECGLHESIELLNSIAAAEPLRVSAELTSLTAAIPEGVNDPLREDKTHIYVY